MVIATSIFSIVIIAVKARLAALLKVGTRS